MRRTLIGLSLGMILLLVGLGVPSRSALSFAATSAATTGAATEQSTSSTVARDDNIVWQDNLVDPANRLGWSTADDNDMTIQPSLDGLEIAVKAGHLIWEYIPDTFSPDLDVSVTVRAESLVANSAFGLGVRGNQDDNGVYSFYSYSIGSDGYWVMEFYDNSQGTVYVLRSGGPIIGFDPTQENMLEMVAVGRNFDLYLNGKLLSSLFDPYYKKPEPQGDIDLWAERGGKPVTVYFTDLVVRKPDVPASKP